MDSVQNEKITLMTAQFGSIEVPKDDIFYFKNGVLGFEELKNFIFVTDEDTAPFKWLISVDDPTIGFPILSPFFIDMEYSIGKNLNIEEQVLFAIITLQDENKNISANLKAPILIDIKNMTGEQIILPFEKYSTHCVISHSN